MFEIKAVKKPLQKPPPGKILSAFKNAMDDDDSGTNNKGVPKISSFGTQIAQVSYQKMLDATSKVVLEDPTIYSYDAHYDQINEKRQELVEQKKQKNVGSKYINNLKKTADKRKVEQSMIHERMAEKELKREGESTNTEKYVTSSFKKMMEEGKKFEAEDEAKEQYNKIHGAENEDNMLGLYKDLYKQDIFMGGFRPDLATILKQPQAPTLPQNQPTEKTVELVQAKAETQPTRTENLSEITSGPTEGRYQAKGEAQREDRKRDKTRSRSRSRSKSPSTVTAVREEQKAQQEPEKPKELSKEEKLRQLKERYQQRKLNQTISTEQT